MSNPQHEPTMEEILASIRKIISEDSTEEESPAEAPVEPAPPAEIAAVAEVESAPAPEAEDVLELTEEIPEEPVPQPELAPEPVLEAEPVSLDVAEKADEIVFESVEEPPAPAEPEPEPVVAEPEPAEVFAASDPSEGIFSDKTRQALDDAFASLEEEDEEPEPASGPAAPIPGLGGSSVEAVFDRAVRETFDPVLREWLGEHADAIVERMTPVIREWMDQHFPPMLEEAVRNEVARVAKARRR